MELKLDCSYCSKRFRYESERRRHELSHCPHFQCAVCSKKFSFLSALRRHEKQHNRKSNVYCECGKKFRDEILLKRHINYAHKGTFNCEKCSASFSSELALQTHMKIHKPESERKFKCSFFGCGKTFNFHHHLKHHVLTHTDAKQYYCDVCKKGFIQMHHLKAHINTHNPDSWLYCVEPNCKKKFSNEYARKRHLLTHKLKSEDDSNSIDTISNIPSESKPSIGTVSKHSKDELKKDSVTQTPACIESSVNVEIADTKLVKKEQTLESSIKNVNDCKSVLGQCLMGAESNSNCFCAQMSENTEPEYDLTPISHKEEKTNDNSVFNCNPSTANCENCECASTCSIGLSKIRGSFINFFDSDDNVEPNLEIGINGAIKIKETFDVELSNYLDSSEVTSHNEVDVPYNSCKAVLGKCIVSGNGTIGEGCLCMKMKIDDEQVTAEEMEEIVPHPNDPMLRSTVINIL